MKIYLAASYSLKPYMRLVRDRLEEIGHEVTSRWLGEEESPSIQVQDVDEAGLRHYAKQDLEDIEACDLLLHFQSKATPNVRGGAIVERGIATGMGKEIGIVGDRVNIFDFMPNVVVFSTLEGLFEWAATECVDEVLGRPGIKTAHERCVEAGERLQKGEPCVMRDGKAYSAIPRCWCGEKLRVDGTPDFIGDVYVSTNSYSCPVHGQYYTEPQGVAISGKARSGKDAFGAMLSKWLGWPTASFAAELKREWWYGSEPRYGATIETIVAEVNRQKDSDPSVRQELIDLGKKRRAEDPDYWIKKLDYSKKQIITDARFWNEINQLRRKGYVLIRIECSPETLTGRGQPPIDDISETELDYFRDWDYIVENDGGIEYLQSRAKSISDDIYVQHSVVTHYPSGANLFADYICAHEELKGDI